MYPFVVMLTLFMIIFVKSTSDSSSSSSSSSSSASNNDVFTFCDLDDIDCGLSTLSGLLDGYLVTSGDDYITYSQARWTIYNINNLPRAIIFPASSNDVVLSVNLLQKFDLCYGVHSSVISHHSRANSQSVINDCITINFRLLNSKSIDYDSNDNEYILTTGAGAMSYQLSGFLNEKCESEGICLLFPYPFTSTLSMGGCPAGGGFGDFARLLGPTCYFIKSVTIVTADGNVITATENNQHSELLWALRGGGQTLFGLVTEVKFRLIELDSIEASVFGGSYKYNSDESADMIRYMRDYQDGLDNIDTTMRIEFISFRDLNPVLPDWTRLKGLVTGDYNIGATRAKEFFDIWEDDGFDPLLLVPIEDDIGFRNTTVYTANFGFDFRQASTPGTARYFFGLSEDDIEFLADLVDEIITNITEINNANGWNIGYYIPIYARGGVTGSIDSNYEEFGFPWRDTNLWEFVVYIRGPLNNDAAVLKAFELGVQASNAMDDYGLNRRYSNAPSFNLDFDEYDWRDAYFGYNTNPSVYNRIAKLKCEYDPYWFYNITFPVKPDCSDSSDSSSSE